MSEFCGKLQRWRKAMKKYVIAGLFLVVGLTVPGAANAAHRVKANETKHTIKAANPVKKVGKGLKGLLSGAGRVLDGAIVDPIGVGLQGFADFVDQMVAAPLEAMPEPVETLGDVVHYVYEGVDKVGKQLAK